jgi:hypothetical protein
MAGQSDQRKAAQLVAWKADSKVVHWVGRWVAKKELPKAGKWAAN